MRENAYSIFGSSASLEPLWFGKLPSPIKHATRVGVALLGIMSAGCLDGSGKDGASGSTQDTETPASGTVPTSVVNEAETYRYQSTHFLTLPFPVDSKMHIQQGWHGGIDYIKGGVDNLDTWQKFPVLAAADGLTCANPRDRKGEAVFMDHIVGGQVYYTYYGHLSEIDPAIPACESGKKLPVKAGQKVGVAGATGVDPSECGPVEKCVHLHFGVTAPAGLVDPYDIRKSRDEYPDPSVNNGKDCGPNYLWVNCPTGEKPAPTATATKLPSTATATSTAFKPTVTPTRTPILPSPGPKPEPVTPTATKAPTATPTVESSERGFPDAYSAAFDFFVKNSTWDPATVGSAQECASGIKHNCVVKKGAGENVEYFIAGPYQTDGSPLLFVAKMPNGFWKAVYFDKLSPGLGHLVVGRGVTVTGTGDCLNMRDSASTFGKKLDCLKDGTKLLIDGGPVYRDGYIWFHLQNKGWAVVNYLAAFPTYY